MSSSRSANFFSLIPFASRNRTKFQNPDSVSAFGISPGVPKPIANQHKMSLRRTSTIGTRIASSQTGDLKTAAGPASQRLVQPLVGRLRMHFKE